MDMERVGLFKEMGYISGPFTTINNFWLSNACAKGRQIIPQGPKIKSALEDGYFRTPFIRIMEGESYSQPIQFRRLRGKTIADKPWVPSTISKRPCGIGDNFGTFSGQLPHFDTNLTNTTNYFKGKNMLSNPGKKGTGYGYPDVTINKYPEHMPDLYIDRDSALQQIEGLKPLVLATYPQRYFHPNPYFTDRQSLKKVQKSSELLIIKSIIPSHPGKLDGGMKAGCFSAFPKYKCCPYDTGIARKPVRVVNSSGKTWVPTPFGKSMPQRSILQLNVGNSVNWTNYRRITKVMNY